MWITWPDSVMQRSGKPVFLPFSLSSGAEMQPYRIVPALMIRIGKLGKSVTAKFAHRYCESFAPALVTMAEASLSAMAEGRFPAPSDYAFDGAVTAGDFSPVPEGGICAIGDIDFRCSHIDSADDITHITMSAPSEDAVCSAIVAASRYNTLKIGDMIVVMCPGLSVPVPLNYTVKAYINDTELLKTIIK